MVWRSCAKAAPAIARLGLFTGRAVQHSAVNRFGQDFTREKGVPIENIFLSNRYFAVNLLISLYIVVLKQT